MQLRHVRVVHLPPRHVRGKRLPAGLLALRAPPTAMSDSVHAGSDSPSSVRGEVSVE